MIRSLPACCSIIAIAVLHFTSVAGFCSEPASQPAGYSALEKISAAFTTILSIPLIRGGSVILISFIGASILVWLLFKVLHALTSRTRMALDDQVVVMLRAPIYYSLVMLGISAGLNLLEMPGHWYQFTIRCLHSIGVIIWMIFLIRLASMLLNKVASLTNSYRFVERRTLTLFDNLAKIVIFGAGTYAIFVIWEINLTAWIASAGIAGIAIGFAAKDTLSNLFAGVFILADTPYRIGDYIVLDNGSRGKVTNIGLRSTRILTRDDIEVTIPNSIIGNSMIINQSGGPYEKMRVRLKVGVAYGTDVERVKTILWEIADGEEQICSSPPPRVRFRSFGPSSLDFELLFWVDNPELYGRVLDATNTKIYITFLEEGIEIPYSKQDLYIKGLPEQFRLESEAAKSGTE
jgi:small-conductance mechanosensitive channel